MEVLLEFEGCMRPLTVSKEDVFDKVFDTAKYIIPGLDTERYTFRRFSNKFNSFVDVCSPEDIADGDRVTLEAKNVVGTALRLCDRATVKPTEAHRAVLAKLFPASTSSKSAGTVFDPTSELAVKQSKMRKKSTRVKPFKRWVVVLHHYTYIIPTAGTRKKLKDNGRIKKLEFRRSMSSREVQNSLTQNFPGLLDATPTFLKCEDNKLTVYNMEGMKNYPNGDDLITMGSKESVYLVENNDSSDDDFEPLPKRKSGMHRSAEVLEIKDSSDDDYEPLPKIESVMHRSAAVLAALKVPMSLNTEVEAGSSGIGAPAKDENKESLEERRRIRAEQDAAYQESLKIDRQKEEVSDVLRAENVRSSLKSRLIDCAHQRKGVSVAIRLPSGNQLRTVFSTTATARDLYEFTFAESNIVCPFTLYSSHPRHEISISSGALVDLKVAGTLLAVEELEGGASDVISLLEANVVKDTPIDDTVVATGNTTPAHSNNAEGWKDTLTREHQSRNDYLESYKYSCTLPAAKISRCNIFKDTIELYVNTPEAVHQMPLKVFFCGEQAIDAGGVGRDLFSAFWEVAYQGMFDGCSILVPALHAQTDMQTLPVLGKIISHGYLSCGFLPVRIAYPTMAAVLLGPTTEIPSRYLLEAFRDFLGPVDRSIIREASKVKGNMFGGDLATKLLSILSRFGCRLVPSPRTLTEVLLQVAKHEFIARPFAAVSLMNSGIPPEHALFWQSKTAEQLQSLYSALGASAHKVLDLIQEPEYVSASEERVYVYLREFVAYLTQADVSKFLRFVTGSGVCIDKPITVSFNALSGFSRRPIAHTCSCELELPTTYSTYLEFASEFNAVLGEDLCWEMQAL